MMQFLKKIPGLLSSFYVWKALTCFRNKIAVALLKQLLHSMKHGISCFFPYTYIILGCPSLFNKHNCLAELLLLTRVTFCSLEQFSKSMKHAFHFLFPHVLHIAPIQLRLGMIYYVGMK